MDLTFQVPNAILLFIALDLASITSHIHNWVLLLLWLHPFILSGVIPPLISSSILGTYQPGEFLFQYPIILPFPTVHGVLKARILKWFAITFSSGPHSVRSATWGSSSLTSLSYYTTCKEVASRHWMIGQVQEHRALCEGLELSLCWKEGETQFLFRVSYCRVFFDGVFRKTSFLWSWGNQRELFLDRDALLSPGWSRGTTNDFRY